jgi:hypothetical protein
MAGSGVRYSQDKDIGTAKNFSWEYPVPKNAFWNDLKFVVGRNFLQSFSLEEFEKLPIDPESTQDRNTKLELLLELLRQKLASEDALVAPETFYDVDYPAWDTLWLAIFTMQDELGHPNAEQTIRMMFDRRKNKDNLSHLHTLSVLLFDKGEYAEAEEVERPVLVWLDRRLGKDSPQALGSRRIIARSIWKQGLERRSEADRFFLEVKEIIDGMSGGKYAVYQDEQRETTVKMIDDLEAGRM